MSNTPLLDKLGIRHPVILAPMGGGPGTPELAAAVSNAGGLGSLGAAYLTPDQIAAAIRRTRELTSQPFAVNLFAGGYSRPRHTDPGPMLEFLKPIHEMLQLPPPVIPALPPDPFPDQLDIVLQARPAVFSFTFGIPDRDAMKRLHSRGITILGTATTAREARLLVEAGVDAVIAQGSEAGAHRGTFTVPFEQAMVRTLDLVRSIAPFAPVIASGGIMDGSDLALMMAHGAAAGQLGTAFLPCPESGAAPAYKQALLAAAADTTTITRAFSGRPARGITNRFMAALADKQHLILPYPLQNSLTRPMRSAAARRGIADLLSLWAGQGVARCRQMPAADLVACLAEESAAQTLSGPARLS